MSERAWYIVAGVLTVCALVGGGLIYRNDQHTISTLRSQVKYLNSAVVSARNDTTKAIEQARNAGPALDARAAALDAREKAVIEREDAEIAKEAGAKAATFGDGIFEVGRDIQPGKYHEEGNGCYYALLRSSDSSDIADNNNIDGPVTITINSAYFESRGCGTWTKVG